jgi:hypothetical protein
MNASTAAMSPVISSSSAVRNNLFLKVLALLVLVSASAFGLVLLFREKSGYPVWLENWSAVAVLALLSGFGSRWILNRRSGFIRFVVAMFAYLFGIFLLGLFSEWKYGIGPFEIWPRQVDVDGLVQIGVGLIIFFLTFRAWRKRPTIATEIAPAPQAPPVVVPPPARPKATVKPPKRKSVLDALRPARKPVQAKRTESKRTRKVALPVAESSLPVRPRKRPLWRGRPKVQLAIVEEHRCPFCLEPVSRVDPRGVVECEVCKTLHHKDCWEITGVCQVPHYNS